MAWTVEFDAAAAKEFRKLDATARRRIAKFLRERVAPADSPRAWGKALHGNRAGLWRYRVGEYRLICNLEDDRPTVLVLRVGHRSKIYR